MGGILNSRVRARDDRSIDERTSLISATHLCSSLSNTLAMIWP